MMRPSLLAALVLIITILVANARFFRNGNRHSSSSTNRRLKGCVDFCEKSPVLRGKLVETICADLCDGIICNGKGQCNKGRCVCDEGYTGCNCEIVIDPCMFTKCLNGGTCDDGNCNCPAGFSGSRCEEDLCECVTCHNNGVCAAGVCVCTEEYTGELCDTEIDRCKNVNCQNDGICLDGDCQCVVGFAGDACEEDRRCDDITCENGGICAAGVCTCTEEYTGKLCDTEIDLCKNVNCQNDGKCEDGNCQCVAGFAGEFCEEDLGCNGVTCQNGGNCKAGNCICSSARFSGDRCEINCRNVKGTRCKQLGRKIGRNGRTIATHERSNGAKCQRLCIDNARCLSYALIQIVGGRLTCRLYSNVISHRGGNGYVGFCTKCN